LLGVLALGLFLRVACIGAESLWYDEVISLRVLNAPNLVEFWRKLAISDPPVVVAPVYFTLEYFWGRIVGSGVVAVRMLSVCFSMAAHIVLWRIGRRVAGPAAGIIAALLFAVSLPQLFYALEIRMYALVVLLAICSVATVLRAAQTGLARWYVAAFLLNGVLVFTHVFAGLLAVAEVLWLLGAAHRRAALFWGALHGVWLGLFTGLHAWLDPPHALWMATPGWRELLNAWVVLAGGRYSNENPAAYVLPAAPAIAQGAEWGILLVTAAAVGTAALRVARNPRACAHDGLLLSWALLPPVMLWLAAVAWQPCFLYRYLLFAAPALYVLVARMLAPPGGTIRWPTLCLLLAAFALQASVLFTAHFRPDYAAVARAAWIDHETQGIPLVVVKEPLNTAPLLYYEPGLEAAMHVVHSGRDAAGQVSALLERHHRVNLLAWRWDHEAGLLPEGALRESPAWREEVREAGMPPLLFWTITREHE
jgi:uncharacterized membrane protein